MFLDDDGRHRQARPSRADRLPPQNIDAEMGVIGSALQDWSVMGDLAGVVDAGDFYRDTHQLIFAEMLSAYGTGGRCDQLILSDRLQAAGVLERVGGPEALADMQNGVPHAANARYYAEIVKSKSVSRSLIEAYNAGLDEAYSNNFTREQLTENAERRVFAVAERQAVGDTVRAAEVVPVFLETVRRRRDGLFLGLTTGLADLDDVTCGLQPQNLIYVAGRTSMGKTSLGLKIVDHQAVDLGVPVLLVTLEMSREEIVERLAVARSRVDGKKVRTGDMTDAEAAALERESRRIEAAPLFIDDTAGRTVTAISANARRFKAREGIRLVVVDLINKVEGDNGRESRREQMCQISGRFKTLARELDVPVVVMAQLNRGPEARKEDGYRPRKSDLKECGNLEEDADLVILLHRPEYYDPNEQPGVAVVIVDKNRNGPTQDVRVVFHKATTGFDNFYPGS